VKEDAELQIAGGMELGKWLDLIGRGPTTGYLWRQEGQNGEPARIKTVNIDGKLFVRVEAIKEFWDRAEAGEFAKKPVVPTRRKS
jgi:hypothetical protein